jgi:hypothetical protein
MLATLRRNWFEFTLLFDRKREGPLYTPKQLRDNAEHCALLAALTPDEPNKNWFKRIQKAWESLAETQEWLEGDPAQFQQNGRANEGT